MDFSQILNNLIDARGGQTSYRIGKDTGISNRLLDYWRKGEKMPGAENLKKLADYFGVSTDYLLGKEQKKEPAAEIGNELKGDEAELLNAFRSAPHSTQEAIRILLKGK